MKNWSKSWKSSTKPRKQRKYRKKAPLHIKRKFLGSHLLKELREKYGKRSIVPIVGDKVKVLRGQFRGHSGKIEKTITKNSKVLVSGIEVLKKDGNKAQYPINASNIIIIELKLDDKKRNMKLKDMKKEG
jgi:large subunit ribosomal protein L24